MLDTTILHLMGGGVTAPEADEIEPGTVPTLVLNLVSGLALPFANPDDPGQPLVIPSQAFNFRMNADVAVQIGQMLLDSGQKMPKPSRLALATSVPGAEAAAARLAALKAA
ncbi:hypothetical protein [Candidatus Solirubrobacter pratensis]|uniref:hypothetical protein n=1 Tax=Candidatus Solirubrobacter pratensis TaxID=1298857 RepID=UPI0004063E54|nr:hypothetical protein [Candidatus Solirubrobacter pratensis]